MTTQERVKRQEETLMISTYLSRTKYTGLLAAGFTALASSGRKLRKLSIVVLGWNIHTAPWFKQ
jgi:hypothetical protein